jgi:anti-sigma B factor antagonist
MTIAERIVGDVAVIDITGRVTIGEGTELLRDKVNSLLHQGRTRLLLNLAGVDYLDSAGLGEIVATFATVRRQGGTMKLLSLTDRIHDLLSITKLLTVFETFDAEGDAIASFSSVNV